MTQAYYNRGVTRYRMRNKRPYEFDYQEALTNKAVADYKEAIRLDPNYAAAYDGLAWLALPTPARRIATETKPSQMRRRHAKSAAARIGTTCTLLPPPMLNPAISVPPWSPKRKPLNWPRGTPRPPWTLRASAPPLKTLQARGSIPPSSHQKSMTGRSGQIETMHFAMRSA